MLNDQAAHSRTAASVGATAVEHPAPPTHSSDALMRLLVREPAAAQPIDYHGVVVGRLLGLIDAGQVPLVALPDAQAPAAMPARSIVDLHHNHVGGSVLLMFEQGDPTRPIVMGVLREPRADGVSQRPPALEVRYDGGRVLLDADTELVLRCGKSHLTLRQDGRVELHGETIVTRAAGANKVQGGSVQLN
jgi:hypothetical protein